MSFGEVVGKGEHIEALSAFLDLERMEPKEYLEVITDGG